MYNTIWPKFYEVAELLLLLPSCCCYTNYAVLIVICDLCVCVRYVEYKAG